MLCAILRRIVVKSRLGEESIRWRRSGSTPRIEDLEGRQLLSFLQPFGNKFARVRSGGVLDVISVSGPGQVFTKRTDRHTVAIALSGTTQDSQVTISSLGAHAGVFNSPLQIGKILVQTGRLGSFNGTTTADLDGPLSPLIGPVNSLQFDALGLAAQIDVKGNLGQLTVNRGIDLGQTGRINVSNDLTGTFSVTRDVALEGGQVNIGRDLAGPLTVGGSLKVEDGGQFSVARNLGGSTAVTTSGTSTGSSSGAGGGSAASTTSGASTASSSGTAAAASGGGGATISGNVTLDSNGKLMVAGNVSSLDIGGNLQTSQGGAFQVGGDLGTLSVGGDVQGKGSNDIVVGDDLAQLTVLGGASGGSLQKVAINVAKNIQGLDIRNGIFNSLITAGILIDGGTPGTGSNGWNIGPDGTVAVFDSEILAGSKIRNVTIGGDVKSDLPTNADGSPTRIVAGEYPKGTYLPGGIIDNFQITGQLIDSVLAASVTPYQGFYPQPAGTIPVGFVVTSATTNPTVPATYTATPLNYTSPPFEDANIPSSELVLPGGSINPSFVPAPLSPTATPGTAVPIPSKSTVLGGVVTSTHVNRADFAGIFAADTRGVIVGPVPPILPANG